MQGVQSQVQAQELAPRTAVMAIRPRFLLVNKLDEAVQFHGVQMKEAPSRVAGKPLHIADILRTAPADAAASSTERYVEEARRAEELGGLPAALQDPEQLPAVPPGVVTPLYAFEPLSESKDRLWLHVRLATAHGQWSPAISLADEERSFFFTESSDGHSRARILRVSIHEEGPTVFVTLDDATEAPPCCVHNETDVQIFVQATLIRRVRKGVAHAEVRETDEWHPLNPLPSSRPDAAHRGRARHVGFGVSAAVPVLWTPRSSGDADSSQRLVVRLCARERGTGHAEHDTGHPEHTVRQFEFRDLHKPQRIPYRALQRPAERAGEPSSPGAMAAQMAYSAQRYVYARVHMHDKAASTRVLHVTSEPLEGEEFDAEEGGSVHGGGDESEAMRQLEEGTFVELALHGISVALVDSKPRELLQLNVREIDMSAHTCDGVACLLQLRVRQLSLDNMIADTDSPVLLASEPSAIASSLTHEGEVPFMMLTIDRRARNMFHAVTVALSPWRLVSHLGPTLAPGPAPAPAPAPAPSPTLPLAR